MKRKYLKYIALLLIIFTITVLIFALLYYGMSQHFSYTSENGKEINLFESIYLSIITFFTIGYGDIIPNDIQGKVIMSIEIFAGLALTVLFIFISLAIRDGNDKKLEKGGNKNVASIFRPRNFTLAYIVTIIIFSVFYYGLSDNLHFTSDSESMLIKNSMITNLFQKNMENRIKSSNLHFNDKVIDDSIVLQLDDVTSTEEGILLKYELIMQKKEQKYKDSFKLLVSKSYKEDGNLVIVPVEIKQSPLFNTSMLNISEVLKYDDDSTNALVFSKEDYKNIDTYINNINKKKSGNYFKMFYFSVVTITTLGYGDIYPVTDVAMVFILLETVLGVVIIGLLLNSLSNTLFSNNK